MPKQSGPTYWFSKIEELSSARGKASGGYGVSFKEWESKTLGPWLRTSHERKRSFTSSSGANLKEVYGPADVAGIDPVRDLGFPGSYPYTRGIYPSMYRGRLWTMRMFSGFGTPDDTNRRLKYLLSKGETGLSIAFDMPTLYGYDADDNRAMGEVGRCGVNVCSLPDMEKLFSGIDLGKVSTSMTINAPAAVVMAMYLGTARGQGVSLRRLRGTTQTDILKEYIAQKEWAFPPEAHMRLIRDMMVYCTREVPMWNYISISGYHIREAGASALQELAFTLADGFSYLDLGIEAGLPVDRFAPRLSFFFNSTMNFFEEVAKFRAARRIWSTVLKEKSTTIGKIYNRLFKEKATATDNHIAKSALDNKKKSSKTDDGKTFEKLRKGDWSDYISQSEADLSFIGRLLRQTGEMPSRLIVYLENQNSIETSGIKNILQMEKHTGR